MRKRPYRRGPRESSHYRAITGQNDLPTKCELIERLSQIRIFNIDCWDVQRRSKTMCFQHIYGMRSSPLCLHPLPDRQQQVRHKHKKHCKPKNPVHSVAHRSRCTCSAHVSSF